MGLFWLFAEGLIMVWVRGGLLFLQTGRSRQRAYLFFCPALFGAVVFLCSGKTFFQAGIDYRGPAVGAQADAQTCLPGCRKKRWVLFWWRRREEEKLAGENLYRTSPNG